MGLREYYHLIFRLGRKPDLTSQKVKLYLISLYPTQPSTFFPSIRSFAFKPFTLVILRNRCRCDLGCRISGHYWIIHCRKFSLDGQVMDSLTIYRYRLCFLAWVPPVISILGNYPLPGITHGKLCPDEKGVCDVRVNSVWDRKRAFCYVQ